MKSRLEQWADWMKGYDPAIGVGHPSRVQILSDGGHSKSIDAMIDRSDEVIMETVGSCVESLNPANEAAIMAKYTGVSWRFPKPGYTFEKALSDAHATLIVLFRKRDVIGL